MSEYWQIVLCAAVSAASFVFLQRRAMRPFTGGPAVPAGGAPEEGPGAAGDSLAALAGLNIAGLFLLLTGRPAVSTLLTVALMALLVLLNRAKLRVLREPLVLADAWLLGQVFKYPHLYFPFLPMRVIGVALAGLCLCLFSLFFLEDRLVALQSLPAISACLAVAFGPAALLCLLRAGKMPRLGDVLLRCLPVSHDACADARRCGPLASALMHPVLAGAMTRRARASWLRCARSRPEESRFPAVVEDVLREVEQAVPETLPHILLIQAESFCDVRPYLSPRQREALGDFLPNLDALKARGRILATPENAFGAYTMRTEFSMLTGLSLATLGPFAYNPYLTAARRPFWSLAWHARGKGYESICLHPYAKDFFRRDKVMPQLGFERFLGREELADLEHFGPYVGDLALGKRLREELARARCPVFCFVITMEAHGPWLPGRLTPEEVASCLPEGAAALLPPQEMLYLCHLRNTDRMLGLLAAAGDGLSRPVRLFVYGDHAPSLPLIPE